MKTLKYNQQLGAMLIAAAIIIPVFAYMWINFGFQSF